MSFIQLSTFSVGQQAVQTADDVAQVKRYRSDARGPGVEFLDVEGSARSFNVLARKLECMYYGANPRLKVGVGATKPGFRLSADEEIVPQSRVSPASPHEVIWLLGYTVIGSPNRAISHSTTLPV